MAVNQIPQTNMKNLSELPEETKSTPSQAPERKTFSTTLSNGRVVSAREMNGAHFIYMESALKKHSSMKKMFFMLEKLSEGCGNPISMHEMEQAPARDIKKLGELFALLAGEEEDEIEEDLEEDMAFPN